MLRLHPALPSRRPLSHSHHGPTPRQLLLYDFRRTKTHLKSTLLEVFILNNLKAFRITTFEKHERGYRLWLTNCYERVSSASALLKRPNPLFPAAPAQPTDSSPYFPFSLFYFPFPSLRERFRVDSRHQLQRILVIHLLQHFVRHLETVNPPERMPVPVILEILVPRL